MLNNLSEAIFIMNDFRVFEKIQLSKYSNEKRGIVKVDTPEWQMINDLIKDYWCDLLATGYLNNKDNIEKNNIFSSVDIVFPYIEIPKSWSGNITYVDFRSLSK